MNQSNNLQYFENFFAEVLQSSLDSFTAQSWQWDFFPDYGALVQVESDQEVILGLVTNVQTGSIDPTKYPFAYQKTEQELLIEQPQIFEFLKTTFTVQIVGFIDKFDNKTYYLLPKKPAKIHSFVKYSSQINFNNFFESVDFLYLLFSFSSKINNLDELLLAILKNLKSKKLLTENKLDFFSKKYSLLTGNDYRRLKLFLRRIEGL